MIPSNTVALVLGCAPRNCATVGESLLSYRMAAASELFHHGKV